MPTRVGIVGKGYFGTHLLDALVKEDEYDIRFVTGRDLNIDFDIDWVLIASSTDSHYELVELFLTNDVNVFCEKPLTLDHAESSRLVELAQDRALHLYVDDVFRYRDVFRSLKSSYSGAGSFEIQWLKQGSFSDNICHSLVYHDLYLLLDLLGDLEIEDFRNDLNQLNRKRLSFRSGNGSFALHYDRSADTVAKTWRLDGVLVDFSRPDNDAIREMLVAVLSGEADYAYNNELALRTQNLLEPILADAPTVAVVGAGVFGVSAAVKLDEAGLDVTLWEREDDLLKCASSINQYRLHRGYHYPRSMKTARAADAGTVSFLEDYPCRSASHNQYYAVAAMGSLTSDAQFRSFMDQAGLAHKRVDLDVVHPSAVAAVYTVDEELFDPVRLKAICERKLEQSGITTLYNRLFTPEDINCYDYVVNATYANLNALLEGSFQKDYQFELCEKPVVQLPDAYKGIGVVVCDGPFNCIDPFGVTPFHLMGNVVHAIHSSNTGTYPEIPEGFRGLLNRGLIENPPITNFDRFVKSAQKFFVDIESAVHIGSMFTIRTVLPDHEHDDARPSVVTRHNDSLYSLFSGKISTCVDMANDLVRYMAVS